MRIVIVTEDYLPTISGVVHRLSHHIEELSKCGDEVLIVCPAGDGSKKCPVTSIEVNSFAFRLNSEYRVALPDSRLCAKIREFRPDVIHFMSPFAFGFRCYHKLARFGVDVPIIFSHHTMYADYVRLYPLLKPLSEILWWITRAFHQCADANVAVSDSVREILLDRGFREFELWPPAVNTELFNPNAKCSEMRKRMLGDDGRERLLLTVSRLAREKNVQFLAKILDRMPNTCLAIVGDGPYRSELERIFANRPVRFLGFLEGGDLAAAYASADGFVFASETETLGNVVLEAMASGCPVAAPRSGGIPSLVENRKTGFLYEASNVEEAVGATELALRDSNGVRQCAIEQANGLSWSSASKRVREIYLESIDCYRRTERNERSTSVIAYLCMTALVGWFRLIAKEAWSARK